MMGMPKGQIARGWICMVDGELNIKELLRWWSGGNINIKNEKDGDGEL
jgi:hypothetical protein